MFLFNSFEKKMKKAYAVLNPLPTQALFPDGENQFMYLTKAMRTLFKRRELLELLQIYASVYTYYALIINEHGTEMCEICPKGFKFKQ